MIVFRPWKALRIALSELAHAKAGRDEARHAAETVRAHNRALREMLKVAHFRCPETGRLLPKGQLPEGCKF